MQYMVKPTDVDVVIEEGEPVGLSSILALWVAPVGTSL
jgi:hypothetical protein